MDPLLADKDVDTVAILTVSSGLIGGAVTWLVSTILARRKESRKEAQEDEVTAISRLEHLVDRGEKERVALTTENQELRKQVMQSRIKYERASVWIRYLEDKLSEAKVPFRPWSEQSPQVEIP